MNFKKLISKVAFLGILAYCLNPIAYATTSLVEKNNFDTLEIGDHVRAHYEATAGTVGDFSNFGKSTGDLIPLDTPESPNGDFYWIYAGKKSNGERIFIADRNLQKNISWDEISSSDKLSKQNALSSDEVKLLMHMDNSNFTDEMGHEITNLNNSIINDTSSKMFGNSSSQFVQSENSYLSVENSNDFYFGTDSFTIEFWVKSSITSPDHPSIIGQGSGPIGEWAIRALFVSDNRMSFYYRDNQSRNINNVTEFSVTDDNWHHIAWTRNGSTLNAFADGKLLKSFYIDPNQVIGINNEAYPLKIGYNSLDNHAFGGNIDEVRITSGSALYSDGYTVPVSQLNSDVKTNLEYTIKLPTGGLSSTDVNNDWKQYIETSNLNGKITSGDNAIWNWSGLASWTETDDGSGKKVVRGNNSVDAFKTVISSDSAYGFRPMMILSGDTQLDIESDSYVIQGGSTFEVYTVINNANMIFAEDALVNYDTNLFEFISVESAESNKIDIFHSKTDLIGQLRFITVSKGESNVINDSKQLVRMTFKAKNISGSGDIKITSGLIADGYGNEITPLISGKTFQINEVGGGDVNNDGKYTLADLGIAGRLLNTTQILWDSFKPDADLSGNVEELDLNIIVTKMLENE